MPQKQPPHERESGPIWGKMRKAPGIKSRVILLFQEVFLRRNRLGVRRTSLRFGPHCRILTSSCDTANGKDDGRIAPRRKQLEGTLLISYPVLRFAELMKDKPVRMFENNLSAYAWGSKYVFKLRGSIYEMNMIHLAGDCAVGVSHQVLSNGRQKDLL